MTTLLVAAAGGHLKQLVWLRSRLEGIDDEVLWVTFDTAQSRSLLGGQEVIYANYSRPRDLTNTLRNAALADRVLRRGRFSSAVSTGQNIAFSFLPLAAMRRASCHYIESAARVLGPSLTGRLLRWTPGVHVYCQYPSWARGPWQYRGSVFDGFSASVTNSRASVKRVVVTVGGSEAFGFRRLVERMVEILPPNVQTLWQTGTTDVSGLPIVARAWVPGDELDQALQKADAVVCHAGIGSALAALQAGKCPVLVPRQQALRENIDDHQQQISFELGERGLAISRRVEDVTFEDLVTSASMGVAPMDEAPPFILNV